MNFLTGLNSLESRSRRLRKAACLARALAAIEFKTSVAFFHTSWSWASLIPGVVKSRSIGPTLPSPVARYLASHLLKFCFVAGYSLGILLPFWTCIFLSGNEWWYIRREELLQ
jgi:hypothetical protein